MPGIGDADLINVSSDHECCTQCLPPDCQYVTYGRIVSAENEDESWACYRYPSEPKPETRRLPSLFLSGIDNAVLGRKKGTDCVTLGLTDCRGSFVEVVPPDPINPDNGPGTLVLVLSGAAALIVGIFVGYHVTTRLTAKTNAGLVTDHP